MTIDFSGVDIRQPPTLVLRNLDGTVIGPLGSAFNLRLSLCYNEVSELNFDLPAQVEGVSTPLYDQVVGMRIVEIRGYGQFILVNPAVTTDGVKEIKACKAYSLEYELTFKKIYLENYTYNFWNPAAAEGTVLSMILELLPNWSLGQVDADLVGKYRTFEVNDENVYHFIKSELQQTYQCIFEFDTDERVIHVRSVNRLLSARPVFISLDNLIKEISVTEDTENIFTCLDINGAEGVNIRAVNPVGNNKLYNLDYFMNESYFSSEIIAAWEAWKEDFERAQDGYFNLSVTQMLLLSDLAAKRAALADLEADLVILTNEEISTAALMESGEKTQADLVEVKRRIADKRGEITVMNTQIDALDAELETVLARMDEITEKIALEPYFQFQVEAGDSGERMTAWALINLYLKEDAVVDNTFVTSAAQTYNEPDKSAVVTDCTYSFADAVISQIDPADENHAGRTFYRISSGGLTSTGLTDNFGATEVVSATVQRDRDGSFVFTASLSRGSMGDVDFPRANLMVTGDGCVISTDAGDGEEGTALTLRIPSGARADSCFTRGVTEYEKHAVSWELYEYGRFLMQKLSWPAYSFSVAAANFLALEDFVAFKNKLAFGSQIYLQFQDGRVLSPILTKVELDFEDLSNVSFAFGDRYSLSDSTFQLADLLDQSVSMGKSVEYSKYTYASFVNSGASNSVRDFMNSALDVGKNAIISSTNQAVSWDGTGLRLRRYTDDTQTSFEPRQIWMANNSIMFTEDNWNSAVMGIGEFKDVNINADGGTCYGIVAPHIVGTLLAGNNLVIESDKKEGGTAVFKMDSEGCRLYNASFALSNDRNRIVFDPALGIACGTNAVISGGQVDSRYAKFWFDIATGNLSIEGTVHATDGRFEGVVQASDFIGPDGSMLNDNYQFTGNYLDLKGVTVKNNSGATVFNVDGTTGTIELTGTVTGNITMNGGSISWNNVNTDPVATEARNTANAARGDISDLARGEYYTGSTTFIDGKRIYAPQISGAYISGGEIYGALIRWGDFGTLTQDTGTAIDEQGNPYDTNLISIESTDGIKIVAGNGGMRLESTNGIYIPSKFELVIDGSGSSASPNYTNIPNLLNSILTRLNALESKVG